jgi:hypothetical protein
VDGDPAVRPRHRDHRVVLDGQPFLVADPVPMTRSAPAIAVDVPDPELVVGERARSGRIEDRLGRAVRGRTCFLASRRCPSGAAMRAIGSA